MQFTRRTEIALGILAECALHSERAITTRQMAERIGVKQEYAAKTASMLVRNGLLTSGGGRAGGLRIAIDPAAVTLGEVVRITQPELAGATKNGDGRTCASQTLNQMVDAARQMFMHLAEQHTLADFDPRLSSCAGNARR